MYFQDFHYNRNLYIVKSILAKISFQFSLDFWPFLVILFNISSSEEIWRCRTSQNSHTFSNFVYTEEMCHTSPKAILNVFCWHAWFELWVISAFMKPSLDKTWPDQSEILQATEYFLPLKMVVTEVPHNKVLRLKCHIDVLGTGIGFLLDSWSAKTWCTRKIFVRLTVTQWSSDYAATKRSSWGNNHTIWLPH